MHVEVCFRIVRPEEVHELFLNFLARQRVVSIKLEKEVLALETARMRLNRFTPVVSELNRFYMVELFNLTWLQLWKLNFLGPSFVSLTLLTAVLLS